MATPSTPKTAAADAVALIVSSYLIYCLSKINIKY